jgi:hypothetical protein
LNHHPSSSLSFCFRFCRHPLWQPCHSVILLGIPFILLRLGRTYLTLFAEGDSHRL